MVHFASADQIARAVVAAARLVGADPIQTVAGKQFKCCQMEPRARLLAFAGSVAALPHANVSALARGLASATADRARNRRSARKSARNGCAGPSPRQDGRLLEKQATISRKGVSLPRLSFLEREL